MLYAYVLWGVALGVGQVHDPRRGGHRALFVLPALLFTIAMVIFPTFFGFYIAFTDWNSQPSTGRHFNGLDNLRQLLAMTPISGTRSATWSIYVLTVLVQYAIAFGLALLLNAEIRARKFFRVVFLLPFMLSPVAVSWMIGKSMMEYRFGPVATLARHLGWDNPAFFTTPWIARLTIMAMDAWVWIPFIMILLLAGLQALPKEVQEAAKVDGATPWQAFWQITFPLMLPVSVTAIVLRIIFKLKLADIVINVTSGGPGGATDTVSSFIYREYRDRSNVGYGTMLAEVYLVIIIIFVTLLLKLVSRWMQRETEHDDRMTPSRTAGPPAVANMSGSRVLIYGALILWAFICLFPIYWTITTSFKTAVDVTQGHICPLGRLPAGLEGLALARPVARHDLANLDGARRVPEALREQHHRLGRRVAAGGRSSARWPPMASAASSTSSAWRNKDISFFFLSQLILPPVVLALPFLVLYKELALLDTTHRPDPALHADGAADRHLDHARPVRHDPGRARGGGAGRRLLDLGRVLPHRPADRAAGHGRGLHPLVVLCWNEYFFAALLTSTNAKTLPVMVASQTGSQGINWWSMAALSTAAIAPLVIIGIFLERYIIKG